MNNYWDEFYSKFSEKDPSGFALWTFEKGFIKSEDTLIDLGCGNARDTVFFNRLLKKVKGVDSSASPVPGLCIIRSDLESYLKTHKCKESVVYARFFFHSIPYDLVKNVLEWCSGKLVAEFRIVGDSPTLYPDHTRYNVDLKTFRNDINKLYDIIYFRQGRGIAPYKGEDPLVARIVADRSK